MEHQGHDNADNGRRDIAVFVLIMLAGLALLSFIWAGLRISQIRAGTSIETSALKQHRAPAPFRFGQSLARNWR